MARPVVLIHGAWHGAWCWERVVSGLQDLGIDVEAVELPFDSFSHDIEAARRAIRTHPRAVVVGHSYGGAVITEAASGVGASHLVYLAAFMQDQAESIGSLMATAPQTPLTSGMEYNDDGTIGVSPEAAREAFYGDCSPEDSERAIERLRPVRFTLPDDVPAKPAWHLIDSTYVVCTKDLALDPSFQRCFAKRASRVVEWDTSHSPFLSRPELLVDLLAEIAR